jgi:flagellar basal-body rod protein FlgF
VTLPDLVASASAILSQSQQRAEIAAQNVANATMPAYKRRVAFAELLDRSAGTGAIPAKVGSAVDFTAGKLVQTGNPYDLAISGLGFFAVRQGESADADAAGGQSDALRFVRAGRFTRKPDGRLVNAAGGVLQKADGGDLVATGADFKVGTAADVTQDGTGAGKIPVFVAADGARFSPIDGGFAAPSGGAVPSDDAEIVQGAYEAANVSTGDEMVAMMQAIRQAESGQRVMIAYDDLMGRVLSTFGESVR